MLGNLARKLRILGYDSKYESSIEDSELIKFAENQRRVIVTKDENLSKSAEKIGGITTVLIRGNDEIEQIVQIAKKIGLSNFVLDTNSSRCGDCNEKIEAIDKIRIMEKVPSEFMKDKKNFGAVRVARKFIGKELIW